MLCDALRLEHGIFSIYVLAANVHSGPPTAGSFTSSQPHRCTELSFRDQSDHHFAAELQLPPWFDEWQGVELVDGITLG